MLAWCMSNTTLVIYTSTFCFVSEQVTLHSLVSHDSFDWTCRGNKAALLKNLVVVVLQLIGISEVDSSVSSPLFKAATKIYNLAKKPKNEKSMSVNMHLQVAHGDLFLR